MLRYVIVRKDRRKPDNPLELAQTSRMLSRVEAEEIFDRCDPQEVEILEIELRCRAAAPVPSIASRSLEQRFLELRRCEDLIDRVTDRAFEALFGGGR